MPCATQNEIGIKEAKQIIANGTKLYHVYPLEYTIGSLSYGIGKKTMHTTAVM